jgi:hypothetical protein
MAKKMCKVVNTFTMTECVTKFMNGHMNEFDLREIVSL